MTSRELLAAALRYLRRGEQIPTDLRLALEQYGADIAALEARYA